MKKVQHPQTDYRSGRIHIIEPVNVGEQHKVYFYDRNGKEVYCFHEDPQVLLSLHQKEEYFMGQEVFYIPESELKDLDKRINWTA